MNNNCKLQEEHLERELTAKVIRFLKKDVNFKEAYSQILNLHLNRPSLITRSSTSVRNQAYSTPLPIAFLLSRLVKVNHNDLIYEPSAGNGALLVEANPDNVFANEIDPSRVSALRKLGFKYVTNQDANTYLPPKKVDIVLANPPFGSIECANGVKALFFCGKFNTIKRDHSICWQALKAMHSNGRAGLIIAGQLGNDHHRLKSYKSKSNFNFFYHLYKHYNVKIHISISGELYAQQGARFPVDILIIDGIGKSSLPLPHKKLPTIYDNFEHLQKLIENE